MEKKSVFSFSFIFLSFVLSFALSSSFSYALITGDAVFGTNKVYVSKTYNSSASAYYPQTIYAKANDSILFIPGAYKNVIIDGTSTRIRFHGAVYTGNTRLVSFEIDGKRAYIPYSGSPVYVNSTFYPKRFRLMQITGTGNSAVLQILPESKGSPLPTQDAITPTQNQVVLTNSSVVAKVTPIQVISNQNAQIYSMKAGQKRYVQINGKNVTFEVVNIIKSASGEPDTAVFRISLQ